MDESVIWALDLLWLPCSRLARVGDGANMSGHLILGMLDKAHTESHRQQIIVILNAEQVSRSKFDRNI